jgi:hypothetical protein
LMSTWRKEEKALSGVGQRSQGTERTEDDDLLRLGRFERLEASDNRVLAPAVLVLGDSHVDVGVKLTCELDRTIARRNVSSRQQRRGQGEPRTMVRWFKRNT